MFCYQCEQTDRLGATPGCAGPRGVCGKDETTASLQDLLVHAVKGIAQYDLRARTLGVGDDEAGAFILYAMFTTLTNVNFSATRFVQLVREAAAVRDRVKARYEAAARAVGLPAEALAGPATWQPKDDMDGLLRQAMALTSDAEIERDGADVVGLRTLVLAGLKGVCAYAHHALVLGKTSPAVFVGIEDALAFLASSPTDVEALLARALAVGRLNLEVLALLDAANTGAFGAQEPSTVRTSAVRGKAILVSGHDLRDLSHLLEQTKGTGIHVYTHGELLTAHAYPALREHEHLVGNYGGAWQDQQVDFARFPGPILMTSNCLIEPHGSYRQRIFTTGPVGWPGVRHLADGDFAPVIRAAMALPGFKEDEPERTITVGFGRDAVLGIADEVIAAVRSGAIRHFFLVGGCDGAAPDRSYYGDFARSAPSDTVLLTLGCNKYRFNQHDFGTIGGIPRLLDIGQCNDSYSAIRIAGALAEAFGCGLNDLPVSFVVSWLEQKAAAVLLTLLALGIRNIWLGPSLPAFLTPGLVLRLAEDFGIRPIGDPAADMAEALGEAAQ